MVVVGGGGGVGEEEDEVVLEEVDELVLVVVLEVVEEDEDVVLLVVLDVGDVEGGVDELVGGGSDDVVLLGVGVDSLAGVVDVVDVSDGVGVGVEGSVWPVTRAAIGKRNATRRAAAAKADSR